MDYITADIKMSGSPHSNCFYGNLTPGQVDGCIIVCMCAEMCVCALKACRQFYLYQMLVNPFREGFLLHSISFICSRENSLLSDT